MNKLYCYLFSSSNRVSGKSIFHLKVVNLKDSNFKVGGSKTFPKRH